MSKRKYTWVLVKLPNNKTKWYQLPWDVQNAISHEIQHFNKFPFNLLKNSLINVPISSYKQNKVKLTTGKIIKVRTKKKRTNNPRNITRSQFVKPQYNKFGIPKYHELKTYLHHDHSKLNKIRITLAIYRLTPWKLNIRGNKNDKISSRNSKKNSIR